MWPNSALKLVSEPVSADYDPTQLITDLFDTLYEANGVGLSAIQIGVRLRVFVMDAKRDLVFINPRITESRGAKDFVNEGCLSLPGIVEHVERWPEVTVAATDANGNEFVLALTGIEAQCVQHELEHLDGVSIPDKLSPFARERLRAKLGK